MDANKRLVCDALGITFSSWGIAKLLINYLPGDYYTVWYLAGSIMAWIGRRARWVCGKLLPEWTIPLPSYSRCLVDVGSVGESQAPP